MDLFALKLLVLAKDSDFSDVSALDYANENIL